MSANSILQRMVLILGGACFAAGALAADVSEAEKRRAKQWEHAILSETFGYGPETPSDVALDDFIQGCPARDCIPSIDAPKFVDADQAAFLADDDLVLGVELNGEARAYPRFVLDRHEVVNDEFAGLPVAITFCPLCGSGTAFRRELDGEAVEFGVSGLLHNSDLVLYDRKTYSLWQQIGGHALVGPRRGQTLQPVSLSMTEWSTWRAAHPQTRVLALPQSGIDYSNRNPYQRYLDSDALMFPAQIPGGGMPVKTVVHGVAIDGQSIACPESRLLEQAEIPFDLAGQQWRFQREPSGAVHVLSADGHQRLPAQRAFWFAWYSFNSGTALCTDAQAAAGSSADH